MTSSNRRQAHFRNALLATALLFSIFAQSLCAATLHGTVVDPSRTPVAGASVSIASAGGTLAAAQTGTRGEFALELPPGEYRLQVAAAGFLDFARAVPLNGETPALDIVLAIAPHRDVVVVSDSAPYQTVAAASTRTATLLRDVPQSISVISQDLMRDQSMQNMADVVRYVPGITMAQGEGHRDAPVIRGNATTADFYVNGVRDDVQYYRDLYNVERVEAVKGANALTFGRGGGGGVINRVTKQAQFNPFREVVLQGGTFSNKRVTTDINEDFGERVAVRLAGVYENSDSFRNGVNVERYGFAPGATIKVADRTLVRVSYEYFNDGRVVDRGVPSFRGAPSAANRSTFFGNPKHNYATAGVNVGSATLEQQIGQFNLRNTTLVGDYEKYYQNLVPGAVDASQTLVNLTGYGNRTERRNLFNQTDVTGVVATGRLRHTILVGSEFGRQRSINFRNTAYFDNATNVNVPFAAPRYTGPVAFRQSATDADNDAVNHIAAVYAQDQIELSRYVQVVAGVRVDRFAMGFHNHRNGERLSREDRMISPRAGLVIKPVTNLSLYGSYSVSYLPSSGDQFSSLTATSQTLKPEKFSNYEAGAKWDASRSLSFSAAVYRLDRTNTTARDPNNPAITVQTSSQRTSGFEAGLNGALTSRWRVSGGYAYQDATVTSATTAALRGALVALVPRHSMSLWNNYRVLSRLSMGLGVIHQARMFAGIDNTVTLPQFTRADAAAFYTLRKGLRLQANVENLLDRNYYATAHSNNNIMPGYARTVRVGLVASF